MDDRDESKTDQGAVDPVRHSLHESAPPSAEEMEAAKKHWQKVHDDSLVARWQHFYDLALRMISHDFTVGSYRDADVLHLAEMLLLLDIATGQTSFARFRSRYCGGY